MGTPNTPPRKVVEALAALVVEAEISKARAKSSFEMVRLVYDIPDGALLRLIAEIVPEVQEGPAPRG